PLFSFAAAERRRPVRRILPPENTSFSIVPDMWLDMSRLAGCGDVLLNSRPSSLGGFQSNQSNQPIFDDYINTWDISSFANFSVFSLWLFPIFMITL
ncbi:MAG: hypothetical protein WCQ55_02265, partial [Paludibacteraceae bacterium]